MNTTERFSPAERSRAVAAYRAGASLSEAADLVGTSSTAVRRWLLSAGLEIRPHGWPTKDKTAAILGSDLLPLLLDQLSRVTDAAEVDRTARAALSAGATRREVAEILAIDESTVRRRYPDEVPRRMGPRPDPEISDEEIIRLHKQGLGARAIANKVGGSRGMIRRRLARHGLAPDWR